MNYDIATMLYQSKSSIKTIRTSTKKVGMSAAAGYASKAHEGTAPAKYSTLALFLDEIFLNGSINALESDECIYVEFEQDGKRYFGTCDGKAVDWEESAPRMPYNLIPLFVYTLKSSNIVGAKYPEEVRETFEKCKTDFDAMGSVTIGPVAILCDSFYYNYVKPGILSTFAENEQSLAIDTVKQAYTSGLLKDMPALKDVSKISLNATKGVSTRKRKKKETQEKINQFEKCINGEYIIPYEWNDLQKMRIPSISSLSDYVPDKVFYSSLNKVNNRLGKVLQRMDAGKQGLEAIGNDYLNFFVAGKPGTGKTTMAYALGAATGMPTYTVAASKHTEEDTFEGMNKVVEGQLSFVTTDFLDAYMNGGIIIIEEINLADPAVIMGALGQAIEFPFILKKDGYLPVRRHPMCVIIGTMNIGTYGSKGINQALSSRFKQTYILDDPSKEQFIQILEVQGYSKKACNYVYNAYKKLNDYLKSPSVNQEDICLNLSIRGCLGALQNLDDGDEMKEALINSLIGKIYEVDPGLAKDIVKDVIDTLPNY